MGQKWGSFLNTRVENITKNEVSKDTGQSGGKTAEELAKEIKTIGRQVANGKGLDKESAISKEMDRQFEENYQGL